MRWLIATLIAFTLSACAGSQEKIQKALDAVEDAAAIADKSLVVSLDVYDRFCAIRPKSKFCTGELGAKIRGLLAAGPLTIGQIEELLGGVK